jgi:hypothetical protein
MIDTATIFDYSSQSLTVSQVITPPTDKENRAAIYDQTVAIVQKEGDSFSGTTSRSCMRAFITCLIHGQIFLT